MLGVGKQVSLKGAVHKIRKSNISSVKREGIVRISHLVFQKSVINPIASQGKMDLFAVSPRGDIKHTACTSRMPTSNPQRSCVSVGVSPCLLESVFCFGTDKAGPTSDSPVQSTVLNWFSIIEILYTSGKTLSKKQTQKGF